MAGATGGGQTAGVLIGLIIGGIVLVGVIGILAAIAIPNLLTAVQRSKQKRTMADMRTIATAIEAYATDKNAYPEGATVAALASSVTPTYAKTLPTVDGWGTELRYECWPEGECRNYAIASAGGDKTFEHDSLQQYENNTQTENFDADIVFYNGNFAQYPKQSGASQ